MLKTEINFSVYPTRGFMSACARVGIEVEEDITIEEQSDILSIPLNGIYAVYEYGRFVGRQEIRKELEIV